MKKLSTALNNIRATASVQEQASDTSNAQPPTSTESIGMMNTLPSLAKTGSMQLQQPEGRQEPKIQISSSSEDKTKLTALVKACYDSLHVYGRSAGNLEASIMLMQMVLGRFQYEVVRAAFGVYLQGNSNMPTPADIVKIIEPPLPERKWCATTFIDIKRRSREGQFITRDEQKYCSDFLAARVKAPEIERDLLESAIKQVEQDNKQYWLES